MKSPQYTASACRRARSAILMVSTLGIIALLQIASHSAEAQSGNPNAFNRLMTPPSERNPPPTEDGIHDPANPATALLQPPRASFAELPDLSSGNYVNWVEALDDGSITPRFDKIDPHVEPLVMDLNIVREVKGSMPNVVYPHKQHTEWLDCSNCHPGIFIPQKGANQISMASILLGEACGVCHGKVAFPVSECRRCHSQSKDEATTAGAGGDAAGAAVATPTAGGQ